MSLPRTGLSPPAHRPRVRRQGGPLLKDHWGLPDVCGNFDLRIVQRTWFHHPAGEETLLFCHTCPWHWTSPSWASRSWLAGSEPTLRKFHKLLLGKMSHWPSPPSGRRQAVLKSCSFRGEFWHHLCHILLLWWLKFSFFYFSNIAWNPYDSVPSYAWN